MKEAWKCEEGWLQSWRGAKNRRRHCCSLPMPGLRTPVAARRKDEADEQLAHQTIWTTDGARTGKEHPRPSQDQCRLHPSESPPQALQLPEIKYSFHYTECHIKVLTQAIIHSEWLTTCSTWEAIYTEEISDILMINTEKNKSPSTSGYDCTRNEAGSHC